MSTHCAPSVQLPGASGGKTPARRLVVALAQYARIRRCGSIQTAARGSLRAVAAKWPEDFPMQNDEAIARSLQNQEQECGECARRREQENACGAARISQEAARGVPPRAVAAPLPGSRLMPASSAAKAALWTPFSASPHQRVQCDRCGQRYRLAGRRCPVWPTTTLPSRRRPLHKLSKVEFFATAGRRPRDDRAWSLNRRGAGGLGLTGADGGMVLVECRFGDAAAVDDGRLGRAALGYIAPLAEDSA